MYRVSGESVVLLWYRRFWQSYHLERVTGGFKQISEYLLNGLSKFAQIFTVGFLNLLSTHPIHIVWGKMRFSSGLEGASAMK